MYAVLYPLQADIRDRSQSFTIDFLNDSFQNLPVFLINQINGFNEHAINSNKSTSKLYNIYTLRNKNILYNSFKAVLTDDVEIVDNCYKLLTLLRTRRECNVYQVDQGGRRSGLDYVILLSQGQRGGGVGS